MTIYRIPVEFRNWGLVEVDAENLEDAISQVNEGPLPTESDYIEGSFIIDFEGIKEFNDITDDEEDAIQTIEDDLLRDYRD